MEKSILTLLRIELEGIIPDNKIREISDNILKSVITETKHYAETQEDYYRLRDKLLQKFVTSEFDFNKVLEFYRNDSMFHAIIEMILRGGLTHYQAITHLKDFGMPIDITNLVKVKSNCCGRCIASDDCDGKDVLYFRSPVVEEETQDSMIYDIIELIEQGYGYEKIKSKFKIIRL